MLQAILVVLGRGPGVNEEQSTTILLNDFGHFVGNMPQIHEANIPSSTNDRTGDVIMQPHSSSGLEDGIKVGQIFICTNDVKIRLAMLAIKNNFELWVKKSNKRCTIFDVYTQLVSGLFE